MGADTQDTRYKSGSTDSLQPLSEDRYDIPIISRPPWSACAEQIKCKFQLPNLFNYLFSMEFKANAYQSLITHSNMTADELTKIVTDNYHVMRDNAKLNFAFAYLQGLALLQQNRYLSSEQWHYLLDSTTNHLKEKVFANQEEFKCFHESLTAQNQQSLQLLLRSYAYHSPENLTQYLQRFDINSIEAANMLLQNARANYPLASNQRKKNNKTNMSIILFSVFKD